MKYESTRGNFEKVTSSEAIQLGMVPKGGLFVPERVPEFSEKEIREMEGEKYREIAHRVLRKFLTNFSGETLGKTIDSSYRENFEAEEVVPTVKLEEGVHLIELWHGPTAAFKDVPLQFMPRLLSRAIERETVVLVATSGDTGKAALEGFKDVKGTRIIVFYPKESVSRMQELQMTTTGGSNTAVVALEGDFDDCQNGVKDVFADWEFQSEFPQRFSSANSINWGRLAPQIVYWITSYLQLSAKGELEVEEEVDIVVPTGNFGDILSAYYARRMGLPVNKLVCASNENRVLADFFRTGTYDANRELKRTSSPAMDILISSNLERFLYHETGRDPERISSWYESLDKDGRFTVDGKTKERMDRVIHGEYATEDETLETISRIYEDHGYPLDPHTAVGVKCFEKYGERVERGKTALIASTANPHKFAPAVMKALSDREWEGREFEALDELKEKTGWPIHRSLRNLKEAEIRHDYTCPRDGIRDIIRKILRN
ncbi:threonine synthase [candidate division MSBL1 archaeon SCGC-AAA259D18]|uniref:Threonine synthase n=1 Tax=candidate division MSBL1 archaeon SCGC-AAA259D18 TaxID=1698262 RepID=A0A133UC64_9EURY|nr:threonine synthase [candidate division MSBL1 archaeon SCGC-AAA259D18]